MLFEEYLHYPIIARLESFQVSVDGVDMSVTNTTLRESMPQQTASRLYDGEILDTVLGHPCIYCYLPPISHMSNTPPKNDKPLIVFIPGGSHLARIAYGVPSHPSHDPTDFLAHHLRDLEYPFLGISYPLESATEDHSGEPTTLSLMPATSPAFRVSEWGEQAAQVTAKVISEHRLSKDVILLVWSLGGKLVVPFTRHAKSLGINVKALFTFAANPGMQTARVPFKDAKCTSKGYAILDDGLLNFLREERQTQQMQHENGREVLPEAIWHRDYYGYLPVSPLSYKLRSVKSEDAGGGTTFGFVEDEWHCFIDADLANVADLPNWIVPFYSDSKLDMWLGLPARAIWGSLQAQKVTDRALASMARDRRSGKEFSDERWRRLRTLVHDLPTQLHLELPGTHYFFLGRTGAQRTALAIHRFITVTDKLESELKDILEEHT